MSGVDYGIAVRIGSGADAGQNFVRVASRPGFTLQSPQAPISAAIPRASARKLAAHSVCRGTQGAWKQKLLPTKAHCFTRARTVNPRKRGSYAPLRPLKR